MNGLAIRSRTPSYGIIWLLMRDICGGPRYRRFVLHAPNRFARSFPENVRFTPVCARRNRTARAQLSVQVSRDSVRGETLKTILRSTNSSGLIGIRVERGHEFRTGYDVTEIIRRLYLREYSRDRETITVFFSVRSDHFSLGYSHGRPHMLIIEREEEALIRRRISLLRLADGVVTVDKRVRVSTKRKKTENTAPVTIVYRTIGTVYDALYS